MTRAHNFKDLTGTRHGRLTFLGIDLLKTKTKEIFWNAICDCGKYTSVQAGNIRKIGGIRSCGCYKQERIRAARGPSRHRIDDTERGLRHVFYSYTKNARVANREFTLSKDEFRVLILSPCYYCGRLPSNSYNFTRKMRKTVLLYKCIYGGIDRKEQNGGYTSENVVPCCKDCNYAKHTKSHDEFLDLITKIYRNLFEAK